MKKFNFIALAVCCAFALACHKDGPAENPYADAPWAIDETLPVPILVSAPNPVTKSAPISTLTNVKLKVIAYDTSEGAASLMYNKELNATVPTGGANAALEFKDSDYIGDVDYYYPYYNPAVETSGRRNYTFFAYHIADGYDPDATTVTKGFDETSGHYVVSFPLNPTYNEDVIVAGSAAETYHLTADIHEDPSDDTSPVRYPKMTEGDEPELIDYNGFNARYQRVTRLDNHLKQPVLNFWHATAQIIIYVKAKDDDAKTTFDESGLVVKLRSIIQANARENVLLDVTKALDVSSYTAPTLSESVLSWDTASEPASPYELDNTVAPAVEPTTAGVRLHADAGLFIVPGTDAITITYAIGNNNTPIADANTPPSMPPKTLLVPDGGYLPGRTYTYNIIVDSDEQIEITTNLAAWQAGDFGTGDPNTTLD